MPRTPQCENARRGAFMFPCSSFSLRVHRSDDATLARTQVVASAPAPKGAGQDAHAHRGTFESLFFFFFFLEAERRLAVVDWRLGDR